MDYRKYGDNYYIRMDKGDEIVSGIVEICWKENIGSAIFSGIGGLSGAEIQTYIPEESRYETEVLSGMLLELASLNGNVEINDKGEYCQHTHGVVAYKKDGQHHIMGGHIKSLTVLITAEIELRPVYGGQITRVYNPETGTGSWSF